MFWIIPAALAVVLSLLNPYVGLFGAVFSAAFLIVSFCFDVNVALRSKLPKDRDGVIGLAGRNAKRIAEAWKFATVFVIPASIVVVVGTWIVAASMGELVSPVVIPDFQDPFASEVLTIATAVCLVLSAVLVFVRCKKLLDRQPYANKPEVVPAPEQKAETETDQDQKPELEAAPIQEQVSEPTPDQDQDQEQN